MYPPPPALRVAHLGSNTPCGVPLATLAGPRFAISAEEEKAIANAQNDPRTHSAFGLALFRRMQYNHPSLLSFDAHAIQSSFVVPFEWCSLAFGWCSLGLERCSLTTFGLAPVAVVGLLLVVALVVLVVLGFVVGLLLLL